MNPALELRLLARLRISIDEVLDAGNVPDGRRRVIPIGGGVVDGPVLYGEVKALGADWNLVRTDGSETVSARYLIHTNDGVLLSVTNSGVISERPGGRIGVTSLKIEAPSDSGYSWLNDAVLVGSLGLAEIESAGVVTLEYWCVHPPSAGPAA